MLVVREKANVIFISTVTSYSQKINYGSNARQSTTAVFVITCSIQIKQHLLDSDKERIFFIDCPVPSVCG